MGPTARWLRHASAMSALALLALSLLFSPGASAVTRAAGKPPSFPIPASERLGNATAKATTTTVQPRTSTPASALPTPNASATPNPGAGTVTLAKPSTIPAPTAGGALAPAGVPLARAHKTRTGPSHLSTGALLAAILAALLVIASAAWVLIRWLSPETQWTHSLMYSVDEASFRASATWAEFADWVRLGR